MSLWKRLFPYLSLDTVVALLLAGWTLAMAGFFASSPDPLANQPLRAIDFAQVQQRPLAFASYVLQFGVLAAILYAYYWVIRYQLVRKLLRRNGVLVFLLGSALFVLLSTPMAAMLVLQLPLNAPNQSLLPSENYNLLDELNLQFVFIVWLITTPVVLAFERLQTDKLVAQTQHQNVQAELRLLQQQINPHFLFNTLNSLYAMCLQNAPETAATVIKLANLLRYAVYHGRHPFVALQEELTYLQEYLSLQMLRVGNRCRLSCEWPEAVTGFQLPPLLLIMLVENAFKHGVESSASNCEVRIKLTIVAGRLHFLCSNTLGEMGGTWMTNKNDNACAGIGLENLRRRLQLLYGDCFDLCSESREGWWHAELQLELQAC